MRLFQIDSRDRFLLKLSALAALVLMLSITGLCFALFFLVVRLHLI